MEAYTARMHLEADDGQLKSMKDYLFYPNKRIHYEISSGDKTMDDEV